MSAHLPTNLIQTGWTCRCGVFVPDGTWHACAQPNNVFNAPLPDLQLHNLLTGIALNLGVMVGLLQEMKKLLAEVRDSRTANGETHV